MSKPSRKIRDKWRLKQWYSVYAPPYLGEKEIAEIPSEEPAKIIGRVVETTLYDITGDFAHQSVKLYLLVVKAEGSRADTIMKGHEYAPDYLRSLVRRGSSRIDGIFDMRTKDGFVTRVSVVAFARDRIKTSQEKGIRSSMRRVLADRARESGYGQFAHEVVTGKMAQEIYNLTKKITHLRHVGIRKSRLLAMPEGLIQKPSPERPTEEVGEPSVEAAEVRA